jgi:uncharacterized Zn finger protein
MARRHFFEDFWGYTPTVAKEVKGGIKAQSKRGAFAQKWWGKRWIQTLESFNIGARLSRGSSYARRGQVISLKVEKGSVTAKVQGSRAAPYKVIIKLATFTEKQWKKILDKLIEEPIYAARMLGNEMPEDIESVFQSAGLELFPARHNDLKTDCSCPDWSNPCKHIAAVYYLLAERFDSDPFLLFTLRGMEREEFLRRLRESGAGRVPESAGPEFEPSPLPLEPEVFWGASGKPDGPLSISPAPGLHASLPKRLGSAPFWRSETPFQEAMNSFYSSASQQAADIVLGEAEK